MGSPAPSPVGMDLFHACPDGGRDKAWLGGHEGQDPGGQLIGPVAAVRFEPSCLSFLTPPSLEAEGFVCFPQREQQQASRATTQGWVG